MPFSNEADTPSAMLAQWRAGGSRWKVNVGLPGASTKRASMWRASLAYSCTQTTLACGRSTPYGIAMATVAAAPRLVCTEVWLRPE